MMDVLPFPRITGATTDQKINELINYMVQFKETLEFALMNISAENLSPDLIRKLEELGADIAQSVETREDEIMQMSSKAITLLDVQNQIAGITFSVDFDTGYLKYKVN